MFLSRILFERVSPLVWRHASLSGENKHFKILVWNFEV